MVKVRAGLFFSFTPLPLAPTVPKSSTLPPPSRVNSPCPEALPLPFNSEVIVGRAGSFVESARQAFTAPQAFGVKTTFTVADSPGLIGVVGHPVIVNRAVWSGSLALHLTRAQPVTSKGALPVLVIWTGRGVEAALRGRSPKLTVGVAAAIARPGLMVADSANTSEVFPSVSVTVAV